MVSAKASAIKNWGKVIIVKPKIKPTGVKAKNTTANISAKTDLFINEFEKTSFLKMVPSNLLLKQ